MTRTHMFEFHENFDFLHNVLNFALFTRSNALASDLSVLRWV